MTYDQFMRKWDLAPWDLSPTEYVNIKMAIRRFDCPTNVTKSVKYVDTEISLLFFTKNTGNRSVNGRSIRERMACREPPDDLPPLKSWCSDLNREIDWIDVFTNLFNNLSNNNKIVQFNYKMWHKISTCKYMRVRMNIEKDSAICSLCNSGLETLTHIYLQYPATATFMLHINGFICLNIDRSYTDTHKIHFITCLHDNKYVNYVNAAAKWYISNRFQNKQPLIWDGFIKQVKFFLLGEKRDIREKLNSFLP